MNISEDFSERLRELMEIRRITMADLARMLHTQPSTLSRWFRGSKPQRNTMLALAEALRVNVRWLAEGEGSPAPDDPNRLPKNATSGEIGGQTGVLRDQSMSYGITPNQPEEHPDNAVVACIADILSVDQIMTVLERLPQSSAAGTPSHGGATKYLMGELRRRLANPSK